jgi:hypothetical protein
MGGRRWNDGRLAAPGISVDFHPPTANRAHDRRGGRAHDQFWRSIYGPHSDHRAASRRAVHRWRQVDMADQTRHKAAWTRLLTGTALMVTYAVTLVWGVRAYGRSIVFAFGINWVLILWAIFFASNVIRLRLPAQYYAIRPFERVGRVYDLLGLRWYRRTLRPVLWPVSPTLLRSQASARETMIDGTKDAETGTSSYWL